METVLLHAMNTSSVDDIQKAAEILKNGGLVALPTETVYGLAANALDEVAVKNIFIAKGRPSDNPLIVHIAEFSDLDGIVSEVTPVAEKCMKAFWPGPFTAVLPKTKKIPTATSGGLDTVAVRMPKNEVARAIIKKAGLPLAAPSANRSGSPSPSTAGHVIDDLMGKIDAIVVSKNCEVGVESTVVSFAVNPPRLLRPGGVTAEQLRQYIPDLVIDAAVLAQPEKGAKVASPGMKYKHYAPSAEVTMVVGDEKAFSKYCNDQNPSLVVGYDEDEKLINSPFVSLGKAGDHKKAAERLFDTLRDVDKKGYKTVIVHAPTTDGMGLAVYNRLIRAAGFKVVQL